MGQNTSFSFFSVSNEKPEPRYSAIPVFLMLIMNGCFYAYVKASFDCLKVLFILSPQRLISLHLNVHRVRLPAHR